MPVFKAYFKVLRAALPGIVSYMAIFLALSVVFTFAAPSSAGGQFTQSKIAMAVINRDGESPVATGLTDYLASTNKLVDLPDNPDQLQDALFFRRVEYVVIIPAGFEAGFLADDDVALERVAVPGSTSSHYVDHQVDKYLNTLRLHRQHGRTANWDELLSAVQKDLAKETPVQLQTASGTAETPGFIYYFGYLAYTLLAVVMLGISTIMLAFNKPDVQQRTACSPLSTRRVNLQLAVGHTLFAVTAWAILMAFAFIMYGKEMITSGGLGWVTLNSLAFTIVCASIGLLVGNLVRDHNTQSAAVNVLTLGMSFISGVFVPQSVLSPAVLSFAKFLPSYWYVRTHEAIHELVLSPLTNTMQIAGPLLIQLGFAAAIFAVTLLLSKERRVSMS